MWGVIIRTIMTVLTGVGVGEVLDKVAADKLPFDANITPKDASGNFSFKKLGVVVGLSVVGVIVARFIVTKLKLNRTIKL